MIALKLFLWFVVIGANVYLDRKGPKRNYRKVNFIRVCCAIAHGAIMQPDNWGEYVVIGMFQLSSYWVFFPLLLNIITKKPHLLYFDTTEHDSGDVDRFFANRGQTFHDVTKVMALIVMVLSIIDIYIIC